MKRIQLWLIGLSILVGANAAEMFWPPAADASERRGELVAYGLFKLLGTVLLVAGLVLLGVKAIRRRRWANASGPKSPARDQGPK